MTSPYFAEGENLEQRLEDARDDKIVDLLSSVTQNERVIYLKRAFHKKIQPIQSIEKPLLTNTYPEFGGDILDAYLRNTTFTVKVWVSVANTAPLCGVRS